MYFEVQSIEILSQSEMAGACSTYGGGFWWENLRERYHLQDLGVDGRIIVEE